LSELLVHGVLGLGTFGTVKLVTLPESVGGVRSTPLALKVRSAVLVESSEVDTTGTEGEKGSASRE
jgi:hypothetical protein